MNRLILTLIASLVAPLALAADAPASQPSTKDSLHATVEPGPYWNVVRTEQFGIAVPQKWANLPPRTNMVLFIAKQGIKDETRQPLDVGLSVERLTKATDSLEDEANRLIDRYKKEKSVTIEGKPKTEHLKLADGHDSLLLSLSLVGNNRRTYMQKLLVSGPDHRWAVSAYVSAGDQSILPKPDSDMSKKLRAHLESFTLDANKLNLDGLLRAYLAPPQMPEPSSQPSGK